MHLDRLLERRSTTLTELAERVDLTIVNLSVLKNGRARAIRFSTLTALCEALAVANSANCTVDEQEGREAHGYDEQEIRQDVADAHRAGWLLRTQDRTCLIDSR